MKFTRALSTMLLTLLPQVSNPPFWDMPRTNRLTWPTMLTGVTKSWTSITRLCQTTLFLRIKLRSFLSATHLKTSSKEWLQTCFRWLELSKSLMKILERAKSNKFLSMPSNLTPTCSRQLHTNVGNQKLWTLSWELRLAVSPRLKGTLERSPQLLTSKQDASTTGKDVQSEFFQPISWLIMRLKTSTSIFKLFLLLMKRPRSKANQCTTPGSTLLATQRFWNSSRLTNSKFQLLPTIIPRRNSKPISLASSMKQPLVNSKTSS